VLHNANPITEMQSVIQKIFSDTTRAVGNRKGVFTRNRQPKMAAYLMKNRYTALSSLANEVFAIQLSNEFDFV
jgi:hypothetical protein